MISRFFIMTFKEIISLRLINQQIAETKFTKPEEIVSYLGAMQSQDWSMAKWAIGLRLPGSKESDQPGENSPHPHDATHLALCVSERYSLDAQAYFATRAGV